MDKKLSPAETVIVVAGVVALLGSFLPWFDFAGFSATAWSDGFFPTYTWIAIFGMVMAGQILIRTFASVSMPREVAGFTWPQVHLVLAFIAALLAISWLIAGDEFGIGFFLSLAAAIGLLAGAWMQRGEVTTR